VCTAGRHEHSGPTLLGSCERTGCKRYRRDTVDALVERALAGHRARLGDDLKAADDENSLARSLRVSEGDVRVSASDASACPRQVQYRERPPADFYPSWQDKRAAFIGTLIHDAVERVRKRLYPWRLFEQTVHVDGLGESKYDSYDPITAEVEDLKTAGDWKWDLVWDGGPPESEWEQVAIYGLSLHRQGLPVRDMKITYVQRAQGKDESYRRPWSEEYALAAVAKLVRMATQIELGVEQPRKYAGPSTSPICARYCFARDYCWNVPEAERNGRSPESWTLLGASPAELEVAAVLREYVDGRVAEKAGADQKSAAKAKVDGIAYGEYDGMVYGVTPRRVVDQEAYLDRVIAGAQTPEAERIPFDEIEKPRKDTTSLKIGKVSKAEQQRREKAARDLAKMQAEAERVALFGADA
jgi:hypothetical protein